MVTIEQDIITDDVLKFIFDGFAEYAIKTIGYNDAGKNQIMFVAKDDNSEVIGAITVLTFFGALRIKYFFVKEEYRRQGIGKQLMGKALEFAKSEGFKFAFIETLSFQALEFYLKLGFKLEFTREGFENDVAFHYLRKYL